jgi:hypothetical protein
MVVNVQGIELKLSQYADSQPRWYVIRPVTTERVPAANETLNVPAGRQKGHHDPTK